MQPKTGIAPAVFLTVFLAVFLAAAACGPLPEGENAPARDSARLPCSGILAIPMAQAGTGLDGVPVGLAPNPNSPSDLCG